MAKTGTVYLVGAGPGDPALLTLRGRDLLARAQCVVYDYLASPRLLDHAQPDAELIYVGKQAGQHSLPQDQINDLLVAKARAGFDVVRLKGGDPCVFGRGGEEAQQLANAGITFEIVPGITAAVAAAAYAGIPVTHREFASEFALITGHEDAARTGQTQIDWPALGRWQGTLAFYMGVKNLENICSNLIENSMDPATPAALIAWGATPHQRCLAATLADLPQRARDAAISPPAMLIVGRVVALREQLNWFEKRPLFGRRIVVTRSRAQASELTERLTELGADVIECPTIRIEPVTDAALPGAAARVSLFDWLILTSVNGVDAFFAALASRDLDARALAPVKICAIGPATADRLADHGIRADLVPERFVAEGILEAFDAAGAITGQRFLLARADIARTDLADGLRQRGAHVEEVTAYRTVAENHSADALADALADDEIDWVTFTSSSTVKNLLDRIPADAFAGKKCRVASIGPITSATARDHGLPIHVEAAEHTITGLVNALVNAATDLGRPEPQRGNQ